MCVHIGKNIAFHAICGFRHPLGVLEHISPLLPDKEVYYILQIAFIGG